MVLVSGGVGEDRSLLERFVEPGVEDSPLPRAVAVSPPFFADLAAAAFARGGVGVAVDGADAVVEGEVVSAEGVVVRAEVIRLSFTSRDAAREAKSARAPVSAAKVGVAGVGAALSGVVDALARATIERDRRELSLFTLGVNVWFDDDDDEDGVRGEFPVVLGVVTAAAVRFA